MPSKCAERGVGNRSGLAAQRRSPQEVGLDRQSPLIADRVGDSFTHSYEVRLRPALRPGSVAGEDFPYPEYPLAVLVLPVLLEDRKGVRMWGDVDQCDRTLIAVVYGAKDISASDVLID